MSADLIARLAAATRGSRELDSLIVDHFWKIANKDPREWGGDPHARGFNPNATYFTSSLDAALTLVPDGWFVELRRHSDGWYAYIARKSTLPSVEGFVGDQKEGAALALCIAALKALASVDAPKKE